MPDSKLHQDKKNTNEQTTHKADSRLREEEGPKRSGSDSNAHNPRKENRIHPEHKDENNALYPESNADFSRDLHANNLKGADDGANETLLPGTHSAQDIKQLHTTLADLSDAELKNITILPTGERLEQGARYIDLNRLEDGEFVATSEMVAGPENYYVPKKGTDYVLWNRLNQVDMPERIDEVPENG